MVFLTDHKPTLRGTALLLLSLVLLLASCASPARAREPEVMRGEERRKLEEVMNLNLRYILNDWWYGDKVHVYYHGSSYVDYWGISDEQYDRIRESTASFAGWREEPLLVITLPGEEDGTEENAIRPVAHALYCIAAALHFDYYDEALTGVPVEEALGMAKSLLLSVASLHKANREEGWGMNWQSPLWAENIGFAAWLLWEELTPSERETVARMIIAEAEMVAGDIWYDYFRDSEGQVIHEGDSKAEEIAWNSEILALASVMVPEGTRRQVYEEQLTRMLVVAASRPEDVGSQAAVDGLVIGDFLAGSNLESDGSVVNHGKIHIDYMTTTMAEMAEAAAVYQLAGLPVPEAATFNLRYLYGCLVNQDLGVYSAANRGRHFYDRNPDGSPSALYRMPEEDEWGGAWFGNCYLCDVMADLYGLDGDFPADVPRAAGFAQAHLERIRQMVMRPNEEGVVTGEIFREGENSFISGELFQAHNLVQAYILMEGFAGSD